MSVFTALLVGLLFSNLEKRILPDQLTIGGTVIGLVFSGFVPIPDHTAQMVLWLFGVTVTGVLQSIAESVLGAVLPAVVLWGGGWLYLKSSITGSILGYGYIRFTGKDPASYELPFGTFLGAAGVFVALAGHRLLGGM